jgi:hypothetical protein
LAYFWPFGNLVAIWYISHRCGILNQEKSGNPAACPLKQQNANGRAITNLPDHNSQLPTTFRQVSKITLFREIHFFGQKRVTKQNFYSQPV